MGKRRKHYEGEMRPFHGSCVPRRVRGQPSAVTDLLCVVLHWDIIPRHVCGGCGMSNLRTLQASSLASNLGSMASFRGGCGDTPVIRR